MGAGASKTSPNSKSAYSVQRSKRESITNPHPEQTYRWEPLSVAVEKELVVMKHSPFNSPSPMWTTSRYLCCLLSAVNNKEEAGTQLPNKDTIPKKKKNAGKSSRTIKRQHSLKMLSRNTWNHCFTMNLKTYTWSHQLFEGRKQSRHSKSQEWNGKTTGRNEYKKLRKDKNITEVKMKLSKPNEENMLWNSLKETREDKLKQVRYSKNMRELMIHRR